MQHPLRTGGRLGGYISGHDTSSIDMLYASLPLGLIFPFIRQPSEELSVEERQKSVTGTQQSMFSAITTLPGLDPRSSVF